MSKEIHKIGRIESALFKSIVDKVKAFPPEYWDIHPHRKVKYEMHAKTDTVPISWKGNCPVTDKLYELFKHDLNELRKVIGEEYGSKDCSFFNVFLIKMEPHSNIPVHVDSIDDVTQDLAGLLRCHLPIVTHENCTFTVGDVTEHLEEGMMYSIDNFLTPHGVTNNSDVERIHMVLDTRLHYGL